MRINARIRLIAVLLLPLALLLPSTSMAATPDAPPAATSSPVVIAAVAPGVARTLIMALVDEAGETFSVKGQTAEQRTLATRHLFDTYSNTDLISQRILGHHWDRATTEDKEAFKQLLARYVVSTRAPNPDQDPGADASKDELEIGAQETIGKRTIVHSTLKSPGEEPTLIDWVVSSAADGHPVLTDIVSSGVSLVRTMKADFTAVINSNDGNFAALLDAMRKKTNVATPE